MRYLRLERQEPLDNTSNVYNIIAGEVINILANKEHFIAGEKSKICKNNYLRYETPMGVYDFETSTVYIYTLLKLHCMPLSRSINKLVEDDNINLMNPCFPPSSNTVLRSMYSNAIIKSIKKNKWVCVYTLSEYLTMSNPSRLEYKVVILNTMEHLYRCSNMKYNPLDEFHFMENICSLFIDSTDMLFNNHDRGMIESLTVTAFKNGLNILDVPALKYHPAYGPHIQLYIYFNIYDRNRKHFPCYSVNQLLSFIEWIDIAQDLQGNTKCETCSMPLYDKIYYVHPHLVCPICFHKTRNKFLTVGGPVPLITKHPNTFDKVVDSMDVSFQFKKILKASIHGLDYDSESSLYHLNDDHLLIKNLNSILCNITDISTLKQRTFSVISIV